MQLLSWFLLVASPEATACEGTLTRDTVVACARANSPTVLADRERVAAAAGDREAARVLLPSNPELSFSAAHRVNDRGEDARNLYGSLSQELELGGQRRKRMEVAAAAERAASHRVAVTERDVVAQALFAYYDALAARREIEVVQGTTDTAVRLEEAARGRTEAGAGAAIEADLAAAETVGLREQLALARGRAEAAEARLAALVGRQPGAALQLEGTLEPLTTTARASVDERPELGEAIAGERVASGTIDRLRRMRAPNLRVSFIAQYDGYRERVLGGGLSLPIPLPAPLGRTYKGELAAARAHARQARARTQAVRRTLTLEVALAQAEMRARSSAAAAYAAETIARAREDLRQIADHAAAGRIDLREALLTQRILLGLLLRQVEAQHELCRASVELARVLGALDAAGAGER